MLNSITRAWLVAGIWSAALAALIAASVAMDANPSTSIVLFVIGVAPAAMMVLIGAWVPSPTVAELLHAVNASDERRPSQDHR